MGRIKIGCRTPRKEENNADRDLPYEMAEFSAECLADLRGQPPGGGTVNIYRNVYIAIWEDDKFPFCSDDCQMVWFHMMTSKYMTPIGFILESVQGLAAHKNKNRQWSLERYEKGFVEGLGNGFWGVDHTHQVVCFEKWFDWNKPDNPNVVKSWAGWFNAIPNCDLKAEAIQRLKSLCERLGEPFTKAFVEGFGKPKWKGMPNRESESNTKSNTETKPKREGGMVGKKPPTPPIDFQVVVEQIHKTWFEKFKAKPLWSGRDGAQLKLLLGRNGKALILDAWQLYLAEPDAYCRQNGQSFLNFASMFDRVVSLLAQKKKDQEWLEGK